MESHTNAAATSSGSSSLQNGHSAASRTRKTVYTRIKVETYTFDWTIYNFSFLREKTGRFVNSPVITIGPDDKYKWRLRLFPRGDGEVTKEFLAIHLLLVSSNATELAAKLRISILNATEEKYEMGGDNAVIFSEVQSFGFPEFIELDTLRARADELLPEDNLTISCEVTIGVGKTSGYSPVTQIAEPECTLSQDLDSVYQTKEFSDVVLSAHGKNWPAHKVVLAARSPVFAAMFAHDMAERKHNRVVIQDIDSEVIDEMLTYIYTGRSPNINKMAAELLGVADKYDLGGLKVKCERVLCSTLTPENAAHTLTLADIYNAEELRTQVTRFMDTHLKK